MGQRHFHFLMEGREGLLFWWNVIFSGDSVEVARRRLRRYLERNAIEFISVDEEETKEVDLEAIPSDWFANASKADDLVAAGGRIWVDPDLPKDSA